MAASFPPISIPAYARDQQQRRQAARWLARQARHFPVLYTVAGLGRLLAALLLLPLFWELTTLLHAAAVLHTPRAQLLPLLGRLAGLVLSRAGLTFVAERGGYALAVAVKHRLRHQLLTHLDASGPTLLDQQPLGAWSAAVLEKTEALHAYYALYLPQQWVVAGQVVAVWGVVLTINWVCGLLLLLALPLVLLTMVLAGLNAAAASQRQFRALGRLSGYFLDRLHGLTTLTLLGQASAEASRVRQVEEAYQRRTMGVLRLAFLSSAGLDLFGAAAVAAVAIYVGLALLRYVTLGQGAQPLTLQTGLFVLLLAPEYMQPLRTLAAYYHDRATAVGAAQQLLADVEGLAVEPPPSSPPAPRPSQQPRSWMAPPEVVWQNLTLHFEAGRVAFCNQAGRVAGGEVVCLRGPSGAGKSSLLDLCLNLLTPTTGTLHIGGRSPAEIPSAERYARCSWASQTPYLLADTVRANLLLGYPAASEAALRHVLAQVGASEWVARLPQGLDTLVGENGNRLSGGERQKVALARALLKPAPLLLLDEPTTYLDVAAIGQLVQTLRQLTGQRTVLCATHDPVLLASFRTIDLV